MNATIEPPVIAAADAEPPERPAPAHRRPGIRIAALIVGAGVALVFAGSLHVVIAGGLLMLAAVVWVLDSSLHDHRTGRRPLDDAGLPPAPGFFAAPRSTR